MAQNTESCKKLFDVIIEKLVATPSVGDKCKQECALFLFTSVKDDKSSFQRFDIDTTSLDVFFMTYLQDNVQRKGFTKVVKFIITYFPMAKRV